jgi:putative transposase
MFEILPLLYCLSSHITETTTRQMSMIITAMLAMSGRMTMLGISRWAGKGGSYRTVQRFFATQLPWARLFWEFFRHHCWRVQDSYLLAGDEVVVSKAGKETHGLGRFFSSLYDQPISGLAFFNLSLVSIEQRKAFPLRLEQVIVNPIAPKEILQPSVPKQKRGRPKGTKNKDKTQVTLTPELLRIKGMLIALLTLLKGLIPLSYLVLDGHFGNNNALQMSQQVGLFLISKLRYDSELYLPYSGVDKKRKYGDRLNPRQMDNSYLVQSSIEDGVRTDVYQVQALHQKFAQPLNIVILLKTKLNTQAQAHVILFSNHLELSCHKLIDYYALRFQIEFNFRDAKQFWGLEDFMQTSEVGVTNAANLSLFMVNLSHRLLQDFRHPNQELSILDLKAGFRGFKYVQEVLKLLPQKTDPILLASIFAKVANLGAIHPIPSFADIL